MDELQEVAQVRTAATAMVQVMRLLPEHLRGNALELAAAITMEQEHAASGGENAAGDTAILH